MNRPLSILLISRTSLIRLIRWCDESVIFDKHSSTRSFSPTWRSAISVSPTMAEHGVRMSCDTLARNCDFAWLAWRAVSSAASRFFWSRSRSALRRLNVTKKTASTANTPAMSTVAYSAVSAQALTASSNRASNDWCELPMISELRAGIAPISGSTCSLTVRCTSASVVAGSRHVSMSRRCSAFSVS